MSPARLLASLAALLWLAACPAWADSALSRFLPEAAAPELVAGAEAFGPIRDDLPVAPVLKGGETIGWAFVTSDFVAPPAIPASPSTRWWRWTCRPG